MGRNQLNLQKKINQNSGFSIIEALTAVVLFAVGIIVINVMITGSNRIVENSAARDELNLATLMILEDITRNAANIKNYDIENGYDCKLSDDGTGLHNRDKKRWSEKIKSKFGKTKKREPQTCIVKAEKKKIRNKDVFIVTIEIIDSNGKTKSKIIRRVNVPK